MLFSGRITFDKMTNRDYPGTIYYTIRNVSLYECLGWCRDEVDCTAAAFSFVVNPLTPIQETTCLLQNETLAKKPNGVASQSGSYSSTSLQKAVNMYFFSKMQLRTGNILIMLSDGFGKTPNSYPPCLLSPLCRQSVQSTLVIRAFSQQDSAWPR